MVLKTISTTKTPNWQSKKLLPPNAPATNANKSPKRSFAVVLALPAKLADQAAQAALVTEAKVVKVGITAVVVPSPTSLGIAVTKIAYLEFFKVSEAATAMVWAANPNQ